MKVPIRVLLTCPHLMMTASPWRELAGLAKYHDPRRVSLTVCSLFNHTAEAARYLARYGVSSFQAQFRVNSFRPNSMVRVVRAQGRFIGSFDIQHSMDYSSNPLEAMLANASGRLFIHHQRNLNENGNEAGFRFKMRMTDHLIAIAPHAAEFARSHGARRISLIPNGIDLEEIPFPAAEGRIPGRILCVGHLQSRKRFHDVIRAFAAYHAKRPEATLEIAGSGCEEGYEDDLRVLSRDLGIDQAVHFAGVVDDVPRRMTRASALVMLSESEVQPWVIVEAMAAGLPVVASSIAAHQELLEQGGCGLLVPLGGVKECAYALERLTAHPALARKLALAGRKRVEERYDARGMADRIARLYEELHRRRPRLLNARAS